MTQVEQRKPPIRYDPEYIRSLTRIIEFTGIPRKTFYRRGYVKKLKESGYVFCRTGKYGLKVYWSYKRLILAFMVENFSSFKNMS